MALLISLDYFISCADLRFANKGVYEKILLDNKGTVTPATDEIEKDLSVQPNSLPLCLTLHILSS